MLQLPALLTGGDAPLLSGTTQVYGIIGDPVAHSLSPVFQSRFIAQAGLDAVYVPFLVHSDSLSRALDGLFVLNVQGFNVTVPHKQAVYTVLGADADAARIGAVNTVKRHADGWQATNTDWLGVRDVLAGFDVSLRGARVLMFGAGGTARAVVHALDHAGIAHLAVCNRSQGRLQELLGHIRTNYPRLSVEPLAWEQAAVTTAAKSAGILINATSIGLYGGAFPFTLAGTGVAVDVVYTPDGNTPFVRSAKDTGRRAVDGLALLLAQGAASFRFWHGQQPAVLPTLRWLEEQLDRAPAVLTGWEAPA